MLDVRPDNVDRVEITCRSKFHARVPERLDGKDRLEAVRDAFHRWLRARAVRDLQRFTRRHQGTLGAVAAGARLSDSKHAWGTCGKDRIIRVHWRLIQAPAVAMEYVVAHELCHLIERSHSPAFWSLLARTMSDWAEAKAVLERWEREHRAV
jgi:predicted metal-dependent hydrolase